MQLTPTQQSTLTSLLNHPVGVLAVLVDTAPVTGLLPFALAPEKDAALIFASSLAKHAKGLTASAPYNLLIHNPVTTNDDTFQIPRLTLRGTVNPLPRDTPAFETNWQAFANKHPSATRLLPLKDFNLYRLVIASARLVTGFGAAHTLWPKDLIEMFP